MWRAVNANLQRGNQLLQSAARLLILSDSICLKTFIWPVLGLTLNLISNIDVQADGANNLIIIHELLRSSNSSCEKLFAGRCQLT